MLVSLGQHQDGTKYGRRCSQATWSLDDLWAAFPWVQPAGLDQTCALCHEVSHRELIANIPSLPFVLLTVFFQSSPEIHDHR